mmetsp:Transcript_1354/g.3365  ORF Transcript_1354/g.3365 Transcript_1354/m.3365 type:complete len:221 (+) Transcript_1354:1394-2056(+)
MPPPPSAAAADSAKLSAPLPSPSAPLPMAFVLLFSGGEPGSFSEPTPNTASTFSPALRISPEKRLLPDGGDSGSPGEAPSSSLAPQLSPLAALPAPKAPNDRVPVASPNAEAARAAMPSLPFVDVLARIVGPTDSSSEPPNLCCWATPSAPSNSSSSSPAVPCPLSKPICLRKLSSASCRDSAADAAAATAACKPMSAKAVAYLSCKVANNSDSETSRIR